MRAFERFCVFKGVINDIGEAHVLERTLLGSMIEHYMRWMLCEIDLEHPLHLRSSPPGDNRGGWRASTAPINPSTTVYALRWWAKVHDLSDPVSTTAEMLTDSGSSTVRRARAMSDHEIHAAAIALRAESVWSGITDPVVKRLLHARELAALNIHIATAHRPGERSMLRDEYVVHSDSNEMLVRFPRTKHYNGGRIVALRPRDDVLCPLSALSVFHNQIARLGLDRGGHLLPSVVARSRRPLVEYDYELDRTRWKHLMAAIGVMDDVDVREGRASASPHSVRATMATKAFGAGWEAADVMAVGAWRSLNTAALYNRNAGPESGILVVHPDDLSTEP